MDANPLGEGVNVAVSPEPYFPTSLNRLSFGSVRGKRGALKRRMSKNHKFLRLSTLRPLFQRDRCTITATQGHPEFSGGNTSLQGISATKVDMPCIGTVLRGGGELYASPTHSHLNMYPTLLQARHYRSGEREQG